MWQCVWYGIVKLTGKAKLDQAKLNQVSVTLLNAI